MEFADIQKKIQAIIDKIDKKFGRKSTALFFFVDLIEEVGELADVIRAREFYKKESKESLPDELADIMYDLVGLAREYNVNLEKAILNRIKILKKKFCSQKHNVT